MGSNNRKTEIIYRKLMAEKTGEERMLMGFSMFDFSSRILLSSIRNNTTPEKLKEAIFLRLYGNDFDSEQQKKILNLLR